MQPQCWPLSTSMTDTALLSSELALRGSRETCRSEWRGEWIATDGHGRAWTVSTMKYKRKRRPAGRRWTPFGVLMVEAGANALAT